MVDCGDGSTNSPSIITVEVHKRQESVPGMTLLSLVLLLLQLYAHFSLVKQLKIVCIVEIIGFVV